MEADVLEKAGIVRARKPGPSQPELKLEPAKPAPATAAAKKAPAKRAAKKKATPAAPAAAKKA